MVIVQKLEQFDFNTGVYCIQQQSKKISNVIANSIDPDQTAPTGAV